MTISTFSGQSIRQATKPGAVDGGEASATQRQPHAAAIRVLLTAAQAAAEIYGVSERHFHNMRAAGQVPAPVVLGPRCLRWVRSELEQSVAQLPRLDGLQEEPARLRRAKIEAIKAGRGQA